MKVGEVRWIAGIALLAAFVTSCIDATTVFVVPDPGPSGDDGGATEDDGAAVDGQGDEPAVADASSNDELQDGAASQ